MNEQATTTAAPKVYQTSLREIFTPGIDRATGGKFRFNHLDYKVSFFRHGDTMTVNHHGSADATGTRPLLESTTHSIRGILASLKETATECGMGFDCKDDMPEGFSLAGKVD
jgi:hypothetical protein